MILSNASIFEALDDGRLIIEPEPTPRIPHPENPLSPYDTTSVDLRLSQHLQVPERNLAISIDLRSEGDIPRTIAQISGTQTINATQGWRLDCGVFVLGRTEERIKLTLPDDFPERARGKPCLAARVEGKSSRARFGILIHFTAPTIHAGWDGPITLEIMNFGPSPFILYPGMPICQLIVEMVCGEPYPKPSQFQGQTTPSGQRS